LIDQSLLTLLLAETMTVEKELYYVKLLVIGQLLKFTDTFMLTLESCRFHFKRQLSVAVDFQDERTLVLLL